MNTSWVSVVIGSLAVAYGGYTLYARMKRPEQFKKLTAMRKAFGNKAGPLMHLISYSILPIALGALLIIRGILGR